VPRTGRHESGPDRSPREALRERKLLRAARRGDRVARDRLVSSQLELVRSVAWRYRDLGLPFDDLVQEGSLGLLDAIEQYDPARGPDFDSYARFRVRRAIRNALTEQARLIRLPKQIVERRRAIDGAEARLIAAGRHAPTPAELAAATGLSVAAVVEARSAGVSPVSLDAPVLDDGSTLESLIADPAADDPERAALVRERSKLLSAALETLPERKRRIVTSRWGLNGAPESNAEVAAELHVSPRRAQTLGRDALYELREALDPLPGRS
jgi:RNA polymerase sigma factor (sigma-70 family)